MKRSITTVLSIAAATLSFVSARATERDPRCVANAAHEMGECRAACRERGCDLGDAFAQRLREDDFVIGQRSRLCCHAGDVSCAIGRAARAGLVQSAFGERQAEPQHPVMQQRHGHRQQRRLLSAMQGLRRGENSCRLAGERAVEPQAGGAIEKVFERRRHVAKARGTA